MEINQKQLQLEMVKLEAEKDVAEVKERTEVVERTEVRSRISRERVIRAHA